MGVSFLIASSIGDERHPDGPSNGALGGGLSGFSRKLQEPFEGLEIGVCGAQARSMRWLFADCELDLGAHVLRRAGVAVRVEPQVFDLIRCLVEARGDLVAYDDLIARVWHGKIVSDATMASRISTARTALGDSGKRQAIIRTVPRRGVQLAVAVSEATASLAPAAAEPPDPTARQTIRYTPSTDGTAIAWAECGAGPPILRGGHWLGHLEHDWTSPVWRPLLDRLSAGRRLVRYDPRGTGLSDRRMNGATVEELADDMEAVADAAGLDRFPIFAASQSVPAALVLAARRPARVSRLVLLNGLVQGSTARGEADRTDAMVGMIKTGWAVPGSAFMRALATVFIPQATPEELESLVRMQAVSADAEVAAELRRTIGAIDVRRHLGRIQCPTLTIHFAGDQVQSPEQSRLIARSIRGAEFHLYESGNHVLVPSDPIWSTCLDAVDRFLAAESGDAP
jgi:pimeloyl-ACP methyl ester carboxylesterase